MVGVIRRSLSFSNRPSKPSISHHNRSISLPCRSHPLISHLKDEITELNSWGSKPSSRTSAWLSEGLCRLKDMHDTLVDLLQLPQTQESIRRKPQWIEKVLEDFLLFVDVYGIFQTSVMAFKEEQVACKFAIRRKDDSKIAMYVKARKKMAKEMEKLVASIRSIMQPQKYSNISLSDSTVMSFQEVELASLIEDAVEVTVMASVAVFGGIAMSFGSKKSTWMGLKLAKKGKRDNKVDESIVEFENVGVEDLCGLSKKGNEEVKKALQRMRDLEGCICGVECDSEKFFRSLISARVTLLNSLTH